MKEKVKELIGLFYKKLKVEIADLELNFYEIKGWSMMGNDGVSYSMDSQFNSTSVRFWDSGIFEIGTDIIELSEIDSLFHYVPDNYATSNYSKEHVVVFFYKLNYYLRLFKTKYPDLQELPENLI